MGKPKPGGSLQIPGGEGFQRMNFLYQAMNVVLSAAPKCPQLTSVYGSQIVGIGRKLQLKMDPSIKRTMCKGCKGILIPEVTAKVFIKRISKKDKKNCKTQLKCQEWKCLQCGCVRNFVLNPDYVLWADTPKK